MADIIIKDSSGAPHTYTGVESVSYPDVLGGIAKFVQGHEFAHTNGTVNSSVVVNSNGRLEVAHGLGTMPDLVVVAIGYNSSGGQLSEYFWLGLRSAILPLRMYGSWAGTFSKSSGIDEGQDGNTDVYCTNTSIIIPKISNGDKVSSYGWHAFAGLYNG